MPATQSPAASTESATVPTQRTQPVTQQVSGFGVWTQYDPADDLLDDWDKS